MSLPASKLIIDLCKMFSRQWINFSADRFISFQSFHLLLHSVETMEIYSHTVWKKFLKSTFLIDKEIIYQEGVDLTKYVLGESEFFICPHCTYVANSLSHPGLVLRHFHHYYHNHHHLLLCNYNLNWIIPFTHSLKSR